MYYSFQKPLKMWITLVILKARKPQQSYIWTYLEVPRIRQIKGKGQSHGYLGYLSGTLLDRGFFSRSSVVVLSMIAMGIVKKTVGITIQYLIAINIKEAIL